MNEITSRENPLIKEYILLRDKKKCRSEQKMFVLEGARIALDAVSEGVEMVYGFVTEEATGKYPESVDRLAAALGDRLYRIPELLADKLSDTKGSQGIFVCAKALDKNPMPDKIKDGAKFLILADLQDPGNVGTIIRVSDAVGIAGVYLCGCCDIYNPKTVRSTMGSMFRVPFECGMSFEDVIGLMCERGVTTYASVIDPSAQSLRETEFEPTCAVVIGNEGAGLSQSEIALCDKRITIKMKGNINSLNAASAAGIFLWELTKR